MRQQGTTSFPQGSVIRRALHEANLKLNIRRLKLKNLLVVVLLFTIATPASAGDRGGGTNWGAVVGAGILGGIIGGATAPAPQQQIIVVIPPSPPAYVSPPPAQRIWWCRTSQRWYPDVLDCAVPWPH